MVRLLAVMVCAVTHVEHGPNHHTMILLQALFISFGKTGRKLFVFVLKVDFQAQRGEFETTKQPHQGIGRDAVLGFGDVGFFRGEEGLKGGAGGGVFGEVCSDFLHDQME